MLVFKGTPEEFQIVAHLFGAESQPAATAVRQGPPQGSSTSELTVETMVTALTRRPLLERNAKALIREIVAVAPGWISATQLAERVGLERDQIAGVFGALGRRFAQTRGWPKTAGRPSRAAIEHRWDPERRDAGWCYRATSVLLQAVEQAGIAL
jgi:hypothetical protein